MSFASTTPTAAPRSRRSTGIASLAAAAAFACAATGAAAAFTGMPTASGAELTGVDAEQALFAATAVSSRATEQRASRDTTRTAAPTAKTATVNAPALAGPVAATYGQVSVSAVAKPKPKPVYVPPPAPVAAQTQTQTQTQAPAAATQAPAATQAAAPKAPAAPATSGGSTSAYAGAGAALGLGPAAQAVYSAIRSTFGITNIGGYRAGDGGDHGTGRAVDVMITSSGQGDAVASYAIANMGRFGITYVIWQQRIWLAGSGGWRAMEDRGSPTQNHMDHVHISVG